MSSAFDGMRGDLSLGLTLESDEGREVIEAERGSHCIKSQI